MVCDACGTVLHVNRRGDAENGEEAGWVEVVTTFGRFDLCTRACVVALMDDDEFVAHHDAGLEAIAEVIRAIQDADDDDDRGGAT